MKHIIHLFAVGVAWVALNQSGVGVARAATSEIEELRAQIRALDEKLSALERRHEADAKLTADAAPAVPRITINDRGYTLASGDAANSVRIRGLVQMDARAFSGGGGIVNNAFVLRRARLISEGRLARNYGFQVITEFGGGGASVLDASLTVEIDPALQFKIGKFKSPVGHELLQSDAVTFFNERSLVTNLVPNRDLGIQASGELLDGAINYQAGVFNGLGDGRFSTNTDFDNGKDVAGRVMFTPLLGAAESPLQGLSLGIAGSTGRTRTAAGRTAGYRTDGQQTFFSYHAGVIADGASWRVAPQFDYRLGSFGALGEYVVSTANVRPGPTGTRTALQNEAWQIATGYVVTGEASSYGGVVPRTNFDLAAGTWGALELVARYSSLKVDAAAFPLYATAADSAREAKAFGLGFNWFLSKAVVFKADYYRTEFGLDGSAAGLPPTRVLAQDEQVVISRFQLGF